MSESLLLSLSESLSAHRPNRILIGFSGGLDSSALLHAVSELSRNNTHYNDIPCMAIHVHHGLSKHADAWLAHCKKTCDELAMEFIGEKVKLNPGVGSLENAARLARYDVFAKYLEEGDVLLLAHHQNDQIETFMMRLMRGSGLTGLSAMQSQRSFFNGKILRPWLTHSRAELEAYTANKGIHYIHDESNTDTQFDRNWWRHTLLPKLLKRYQQANASIVKTINVLQQERQLLSDLMAPIYEKSIDKNPQYSRKATLHCQSLLEQPLSVQNQLIRMWLESQQVYPLLNAQQMAIVLLDVVKAKDDASPIYQWQQHQIRRHDQRLYVLMNVKTDGVFPVSKKTIELRADEPRKIIPYFEGSGELSISGLQDAGLKPGGYELAYYSGSLQATPFKRPSKPLKKWFQEYGVPPWLRAQWPVILKDGQVACVPGLFICDPYAVDGGLRIEYRPN